MNFFDKNIYKFELRRNFKTFLIWFISLSAMSIMMMAVFPLLKSIDVDALLSQLGMPAMFGLGTNYSVGYFALEIILLIQLAGIIYAAGFSIKLLQGEEKDRTAEFLLANPIDRKKIWSAKLLTLITYITVFVLAIAIVNFVLVLAFQSFGSVQNTAGDYAGFWLLFFATYLMMLSIGFVCYLLSAILSRRSSTGIAIGISLGTFIITIIYGIVSGAIENNILKEIFRIFGYLSPFTFGAAEISIGYLGHQAFTSSKEFWLTMIGALLWIILGITALFFSRKKYYKKDIL